VKRIYLLRHAKSSWKQEGLADHDRPLAGRGRWAAGAIADHLRSSGIEPERVLCSTARRARETLDPIASAFPASEVEFQRELYGAGAQELLERLRRLPDTVASVLVIGHNPGIEELATELARPGAPLLAELEPKYPTGALAALAFAGKSWSELDARSADLVGFVRPRDLAPATRRTSRTGEES
jgi:phosphohistidine phosphatase